jgi:hypothetical protein
MGYYTRVTGELVITPPLTAAEIRHWEANVDIQQVNIRLKVAEETLQVEEGELTKRTAAAVLPWSEDRFKAYSVIEDVQAFLNMFGTGHQLTGWFDCAGEEDDDLWRLHVIDGKATKIEPQIVWPNIP